MEPEVHVVEKWLQVVHKCFTATNVRADGSKEIDILGINPRKNISFHIECNCRVGHKLTPYKPFMRGNRQYSDELEYFSREKFSHSKVIQRIREYLGEREYQKTLIVWGLYSTDGGDYTTLNRYSLSTHGFNVRLFSEILSELRTAMKQEPGGHRDDVLRLIELNNVEDAETEKSIRWFTGKVGNRSNPPED